MRSLPGFAIGAPVAVLAHVSVLLTLASIAPRQASTRPAPMRERVEPKPVEIDLVSEPPAAAIAATASPSPSLSRSRRPVLKRRAAAVAPSIAEPTEPAPGPGPPPRGAKEASNNEPHGLIGMVSGAASTATTVAVPRYRSNPPPPYPRQSLRRREEGVTLLSVTVGADGQPHGLSITRSSGHPLLDQAALDAVRSWTFAPAQIAGQIVSSRALVPVRFSLTAR